MIKKTVIRSDRIRRLAGTFGYIEHRFLRDGFLQSLTHQETTLYLFLTLAADRHGLSYYSYDKICKLLNLELDDYILARNGLIKKDLIAFDGAVFQVLSLPGKTVPAK